MSEADYTPISPPVARIVAILNFLAGHPDQAFTLTELTRSLRLSTATAHALLNALNESGYVYRTAAKSYVLGPTLSRIGRAALDPAAVMTVARPEMRLLADEFDVVCSAAYREGDDAVIFERAAALSHLGWHPPQRPRVALNAPLGGIFLAWDDRAVNEWLAKAEPAMHEEEQARLLQSLQFLRTRGFSFAERKVPLDAPDRARALQNRADLTDYGIGELDTERPYDLAFVVAPVFSLPGKVAFTLSLAGFDEPVPGAAIERMGARLRATCDRIGTFIADRNFTGGI